MFENLHYSLNLQHYSGAARKQLQLVNYVQRSPSKRTKEKSHIC